MGFETIAIHDIGSVRATREDGITQRMPPLRCVIPPSRVVCCGVRSAFSESIRKRTEFAGNRVEHGEEIKSEIVRISTLTTLIYPKAASKSRKSGLGWIQKESTSFHLYPSVGEACP